MNQKARRRMFNILGFGLLIILAGLLLGIVYIAVCAAIIILKD